MRRGDLGEPARGGEARRPPRGRTVDAAVVGGRRSFLSGEISWESKSRTGGAARPFRTKAKSAVAFATVSPFLGFGFFRKDGKVKVRLDPKARATAKARLRRLTARSWRVSMEMRIAALNRFTRGWTACFALADTPSVFAELDEWLRRRLRQVRWKEWKKPRACYRGLVAQGISSRQAREWAHSGRSPWRVAGSPILSRALAVAYWQQMDLAGFLDPYRQLRDALRTAGCGPACPVAWEGPG